MSPRTKPPMPAARPRKQGRTKTPGTTVPVPYAETATYGDAVFAAVAKAATKPPRESAFEELRRTAQAYRDLYGPRLSLVAEALDAALKRVAGEGKE